MKSKQYISVSGIETIDQINSLEQVEPRGAVTLLVGVQASEKSQYRKIGNSRGPNWHPVGDDIWKLFGNDEDHRVARRVIHYSYADTQDPNDVARLTGECIDRIPGDCRVDGWQFNNLAWHEKDYTKVLGLTKARLGADFIIAQLSGSILAHSDPVELAKRLAESGVSHTLLDSSGGSGKSFDETLYERFLEALARHAPDIGLGVAGGLGPGEHLEPYRRLLAQYPDLSCDAEGKLRDYPKDPATDQLKNSMLSTDNAKVFVLQAYASTCGHLLLH